MQVESALRWQLLGSRPYGGNRFVNGSGELITFVVRSLQNGSSRVARRASLLNSFIYSSGPLIGNQYR